MASKFRRNGTWYIKYKDVDGKWKNYSCGPDAKAGDAEALRAQYSSKEFNTRHNLTVKKVEADLEKTMLDFRDNILPRSEIGRDKAKNTIRREKVVIDNFIIWATGRDYLQYNKVTPEVALKYFDHLLIKEKAAKTRREERRILAKFFKWAIEQGYCQSNPIVDIPNPQRDKRRPRFFTEAELKIIFSAPMPYRNIFRFLFLTGIRVGELGNLITSDYLKDQKLLLIRVLDGNKTKREETVPLSESAIKVLDESTQWKSKFDTSESKVYIFVNNEGNKIDNENVLRALKRVCNEKISGEIKTHTLRHTCASHLVISGVSLYVVKDILRHASIKETEIYAHLSKDVVRTAIEKLSA